MSGRVRVPVRLAVVLTTAAALAAVPSFASAAARTSGPAPGGPGKTAPYLPSDKVGFGTAQSRASNVWYTLAPGGGAGELYYPTLDTPASRRLGFVVADKHGHATSVDSVGTHRTTLTGAGRRGLTYTQTDTGPHSAWRLTTTWVTDPRRPTLLVHVRFRSLDHAARRLYALYEPTLSNTPSDDKGSTVRRALLASDAHAGSALLARPAFTATSVGYRGVNGGWADLRAHGVLTHHYTSAAAGNLVQTGRTALTGVHGHDAMTLAVGLGPTASTALRNARLSTATAFRRTAASYAAGWSRYLSRLHRPPPSLRTTQERREYLVSALVLAASEDKRNPGAYVASPSMPWSWGDAKTQSPSGPYHLVWSRDLYEIATALIADGDVAGANRALTFLFDRQQKADGSFPQNSSVNGKPFWTGLQLDEVADPIVLAYQLHRTGPSDWAHVKKAADFIVSFKQDGHSAPWTPQERWENQDGYSPATIASEIAGLVCAAQIARHNGDPASAKRYLATADSWHAHLKGWTATTNGPYSTKAYFLRLTKDGQPNKGTTYSIGDGGPGAADQRTVVDPSFLELVRLGVLPAGDPTVRNSIKVVDKELSYQTPRGQFWHRASFDGYGEQANGGEWFISTTTDTFATRGRGWPLLTGERGEYEIASGDLSAAAGRLRTMAATANSGGLLPEQVWDNAAPGGTKGFTPGTPTFSATPLAWTHAQFIRLAQDLAHRQVSETPAPVAARYGG